MGIIHRDIKPANILLRLVDGVSVAKLADFNVMKVLNGYAQLTNTLGQGTPLYMAPEVWSELTGEKGEGYSSNIDIFSLCATFYHVIKGEGPYAHNCLN